MDFGGFRFLTVLFTTQEPPAPMQEFASVLTQTSLRTYMSVEGLAGHSQFPAEIGDLRFGLAHRRKGQPHLGRGHFKRRSSLAAAGASGGQPSLGPLGDELALKFCKSSKNAEHQLAGTRGGGN